MPRTQVNSSTGIMGTTGTGKSALLGTLAESVWRRFKKVTRYYNSDGGGFPAKIQKLQALGIMEVFRMRTRDPGDQNLSFETAYRSCQGWWPRKINPATGEVPPSVEMVPPIALRFEMRCAQGHLVKTVPAQSMLTATICPECRKPVTAADMQVSKSVVVNKGFEHVGAVCFDGLTSMLSWEMMELGQRAGRLELRGEEGAIGGKVVSGDLKFGGVTRSHVGFAQTRGEELVHLALGIPNLVVPPVFTMLTHEDVDERSLSITGPKIAGRAKTDEAPAWFGNLLECAKIPAREGTGEQRVLYLAEFTDQFGRRHLCKNRADPGTMPVELLDPPNTDLPENRRQAFTQFNLGVFFELLDAALDEAIEEGKTEFPDAPGLKEGWVEIGGGNVVELPSSLQPVPAPVAAAGPQVMQVPGGAAATPSAPAAPRRQAPKKTPAAPAPVNAAPVATPVPQTAAAPSPAPAQDAGAAGEASTVAEPPVPPANQPAGTPAVAAPASAPTPTPAPAPAPAPAPHRPVTAAPPAGARPGTPAGSPVRGPATPAGAAMRAPAAAPRTPVKPRVAPPAATPAPTTPTTTTS